MRAVISLVLFIAATMAGCIESAAVPCGDGVCAPGTTCEPTTGRCISDAQRAACDGLAEGASCSITGALGVCSGGACATFSCGDGLREGTERCDGTDLGGATCGSLGYYEETTGLACTADCLFDVTGCTRTCGDGLADAEEQCDGADLGSATNCTKLGFYEPGPVTCTASCRWDDAQCRGFCGDHILNGPEVCDGTPPVESCVDFGFDAGPAGCSASCGASYALCARLSWKGEPSGATSLAGMHATTSAEWGVGNGGFIARHVGASWEQTPAPTTDDLGAVWTDGTRAWAVTATAPGQLLAWDGTSWSLVTGGPANRFVDVWGTGATAFVGTRDAGVFASDGATWTPVGALPCTQLKRLGGTSATDVWAGCSTGLYHYDGTAWTLAREGSTHDIAVIDAQTVVHSVFTTDGELLEVLDHGTWSASPQTKVCTHVAAQSPRHIWCGTSNGEILHFDGARSVTVDLVSGTSASVMGIATLGPAEVVVVTADGNIYRNRGSVLTDASGIPGGGDALALGVAPDDARFVTMGAGAVSVLKLDQVGWIMGNAFVQAPDKLTAVWASSKNDAWAGSQNGLLFHYDGTSTWTAAGTFESIDAIAGTAADDVWMFTRTVAVPHVYHYDGTSWTLLPDAPGATAQNVVVAGPNDVWVSGGVPARLFHWDGAWSPVHELSAAITSFSVVRPDFIVASTNIRGIYTFDGADWQEVAVPSPLEIKHVVAFAPDDIFAASDQGLIHFDGMAWAPVRLPLNTAELIVDIRGRRGRLEILSDSPLNGFRVRSLLRFTPWVCRASELDCADEVDDDCDGLIDADDSDCP